MKLLWFMTHAGYARNFEWTLRLLAERGHAIDVVLENPDKPDVAGLLDRVAADHPNVTVEAAPRRAEPEWCDASARIRACLDYLQYLHPSFVDADMLRARGARRLPGWLVTGLNLAALRQRDAQRTVRRLLVAGYQAIPADRAAVRFIADRAPDVVLITPLVELASKQADHFDAARAVGIPVGVTVASWDNLHSKGTIHEVPELVTVWNETQRREAVGLHGIPAERVAVTGAVAYDHWYEWRPERSREAFCAAAGLDSSRPFALYVGSGRSITPGEAGFALRCISGLRDHPDPGLSDLQWLIRPHPQNPMRGEGVSREELEALGDVVVYPPAGANPTDAESRADYFDSMYHCSAVFGVNTTAFIEATIVDRPVHSLLAGEYATTQSSSPQFRVMRPENQGMLALANSVDELARELAASLRDAGPARSRNRAFRDHFLRPAGAGVASSPRLVEAIEGLPDLPRVEPPLVSARLRVAGRTLARAVRAYASHERREAKLATIGDSRWRQELAELVAKDKARQKAAKDKVRRKAVAGKTEDEGE